MGVDDPRVRFEVLGPLRVRLGDEALTLGGPKPRALLGILLVHSGEPVGVEELTEALWDGEPPPSASANLRSYVHALRQALEPVAGGGGAGSRVESRPPGYLIRVEPGELDLLDFWDLEARGRRARDRGEIEDAARWWRRALDLWRGRPLAGTSGGPRLTAALIQLQERRLRVAEAWIDARLALGAHAELVSELRGLVAAEPLHEPMWARLMVALHRTGRTADALAAYGEARRRLVEDLGVEPGQQLQRTQLAILAGDAVVDVHEAAPREQQRRPPDPAPKRSAPPEATPDLCPYQGLTPFVTADAPWFFGRERLVAELVTYLSSQLTPPSLVAVVGPSGSGKSSLLRAGLLPVLADGALPAAKGWPAVVLTPGSRPLASLEQALVALRPPDPALGAPSLLDEPRRFGALVAWALGADPAGRRLVLVVDQLEELFTLCQDEDERQAFVTALSSAAGVAAESGGAGATAAATVPAVIVLGLRADFYGHCIAYPELLPALSGGQVIVEPMTEAELRHAIERPAARAGLTLEPGLVDLLLSHVGVDRRGGMRADPGSLPLLSHALLAIWELRDDHRLTVAGYHKAGGIHGAIATTADAVYERLGPDERTVARQLFTRLVAFGGENEDTSRRISHDELLDGCSEAEAGLARGVLDVLAGARLIVLATSTIEIAHEALIKRWPRLQEWLTEDREGLRTHRQLTDAAHAWATLGRDPDALYRGTRLAVALGWADRDAHEADLNALERAFLHASVALTAADGRAVRRRTVRSRQVTVAILVLVLLATIVGGFALRERHRGAEQARITLSQELARSALDLPSSRRSTAMLLAVEAYRTAPTVRARAALSALTPPTGYRDALAFPGDRVSDVAFSPDGTTLAAAGADGAITVWDVPRRAERARFTAHPRAFERVNPRAAAGRPLTSIAFAPDGSSLASGGEDGALLLWDPASRRRTATLRTRGGAVTDVAFSADGRVLASGHDDGTVVLWDPASRRRTATLRTRGAAVNGVAFSPDGRVLASGGEDGALLLWDPASRRRTATLRTRGGAVTDVAFGPDSTLAVTRDVLAGGDRGHPVELWDVRERSLAARIPDPIFSDSVAFSPDGATLAVGSRTEVVLWDLKGGLDQIPPTMHARVPGGQVAFAPDGTTLVAADTGGVVTLLDPAAPQIITDYWIRQLDLTPDGRHLATSDSRHRVDLWDVTTKTRIASLDTSGHRGGDPSADLVLSRDGKLLARGGWFDVTVWRPDEDAVTTLQLPPRPIGISPDEGLERLGFSADGGLLFGADAYHDTLFVWDVQAGTRTGTSVPGLASAALSPDDRVLATTTEDGVVTLWDFPDMRRPTILTRAAGAPGSIPWVQVAFGHDASTLATIVGRDITLWDLDERRPTTAFSENFDPRGIALARDDRTVLLVGQDGSTQRMALWDATDRTRAAALLVEPPDFQAMASDTGFTLLAASHNGAVHLLDLDPDRAAEHICATLGRSLDQAAWDEFLSGQPYRATCG